MRHEQQQVFVSGDPPASVMFELQRIGRGWFAVERLTRQRRVSPETLAFLRYCGAGPASGVDVNIHGGRILDVVCSRSSPLELTCTRSVERYDIAEPIQRLMLLARLASLHSAQGSVGSGPWTVGISRCVRDVQLAFSLHMSIDDLAARLDVDPTTLRRWIRRDEGGSPEEFLRLGRVRAVFEHVRTTGETLAETSRRLGFSAPSNLSRTVRMATGLSLRELLRVVPSSPDTGSASGLVRGDDAPIV